MLYDTLVNPLDKTHKRTARGRLIATIKTVNLAIATPTHRYARGVIATIERCAACAAVELIAETLMHRCHCALSIVFEFILTTHTPLSPPGAKISSSMPCRISSASVCSLLPTVDSSSSSSVLMALLRICSGHRLLKHCYTCVCACFV